MNIKRGCNLKFIIPHTAITQLSFTGISNNATVLKIT
jgi:hypothetical protein